MSLLDELLSRGYSEEDAEDTIQQMKRRVRANEPAELVLYEEGIDSEYVSELFDE